MICIGISMENHSYCKDPSAISMLTIFSNFIAHFCGNEKTFKIIDRSFSNHFIRSVLDSLSFLGILIRFLLFQVLTCPTYF